jgi:hypothetical protein
VNGSSPLSEQRTRLLQNAASLLRFAQCAFYLCASGVWIAVPASSQVVTVDTTSGRITNNGTIQGTSVDRRYSQITPTHIDLPNSELDAKTRIELERFLESDQGFAMRPFPKGHKGLTLAANGKLEPAGEAYLAMVTSAGLSAKPGDRLVLTDVKIDKTKMVFDINGGPDAKHRFLRHVQVGGGPQMTPVVQDANDPDPVGARLTLTFKDHIPELTGKQVESLLAPLISFEVKTPIQAFTDTLPPKLKDAILDHNVLVGMSTEMVLFAKGQPQSKIREMDGQMPFEEWIYGKAPSDIEFVRINGNRVIRVEIAKVGKTPEIFTKDEVEGMMRTDGTPLTAENTSGTRTVQLGDVERDPDKQAPAAPPSLRKDGEALPTDTNKDSRVGVMRPVQFPKQEPDDEPNAHPNDTTVTSPTAAPAKPPSGSSQSASPSSNASPAATSGSQPSDASKPQPAPQAPASSSPQ